MVVNIRLVKFLLASVFVVVLTLALASMLADRFGVGILTAIPPVVAFLSLEIALFKHYSREEPGPVDDGTGRDEDTRGRDSESTDLPSDSGGVISDSASQDVDRPESDVAQSSESPVVDNQFLQTDHDLLTSGLDELDESFTLYEDGEIAIDENASLNVYAEMMLYVIAARYASEVGCRESAVVSGAELMGQLGRTKGEVGAFLNEAGNYTTNAYHWDWEAYNDLDDREFEVNVKQIPDAVEWILGDGKQPYRYDLHFGTARKCLTNAVENCDAASRSNRSSDEYDSAAFEVVDAFRDVSDYPVAIADDTLWNDFTKYVDAAIDSLQQGRHDQIDHCLQRLDDRLEKMANKRESL